MPRPVTEGTHRQHHRNLDEDADYGGQGRSRTRAEQCDCSRHSEFKEVAGSNERSRSGNGMTNLEQPHESISERRIEVNLQKDRNRDQDHVERLPGNVIRLESENQH